MGLFKIKEKKAIQEQIDALALEKDTVRVRAEDAKQKIKIEEKAAKAIFQREIDQCQKRIEGIDRELTRAR